MIYFKKGCKTILINSPAAAESWFRLWKMFLASKLVQQDWLLDWYESSRAKKEQSSGNSAILTSV